MRFATAAIIFFCGLVSAAAEVRVVGTDSAEYGFNFVPERNIKWQFRISCPLSFGDGVDYGMLAGQSIMFLGLENGIRLREEKTWNELRRGEFFPDWINSIRSFRGWSDGNKIFTNWVAHPMQGSVSAFIFANNDAQSRRAKFGDNADYYAAKKRQFVFAFIYSAVFELGPISEASIGNVGLNRQTNRGRQSMEDFVLTPVLGILWSVGEDMVDGKLANRLANDGIFAQILFSLLTPTHSLANLFAFRAPWHRQETGFCGMR